MEQLIEAWESDYRRLEQCNFPGIQFHKEDLRRRISSKREELHAKWPKERAQHRLDVRLADARKELDRAEMAAADLDGAIGSTG